MEELNVQGSSQLLPIDKTGALIPTLEESAVLGITERLGFRLTHLMNLGVWKRLMSWCQRHVNSLWMYIATYNLMNVSVTTLFLPSVTRA